MLTIILLAWLLPGLFLALCVIAVGHEAGIDESEVARAAWKTFLLWPVVLAAGIMARRDLQESQAD